jgi:hypothetical protein
MNPEIQVALYKPNKPPRIPDKRIIITDTILLIEYKEGYDLMIHRGDERAERIIKQISI